MFKRDQAVFITEKCGDSNGLYTLQEIPNHTLRTRSRGGPYVATFGEEELDPKPSLPRPGFAPPWRTPRQAWSQHGFQATTPPPIPRRVGYNWVQVFRSTKLSGLLVPYVSIWPVGSTLSTVKHTIVPYSFFGSEYRVRTPFLLCTQRPPYPTLTTALLYQVNLCVIF